MFIKRIDIDSQISALLYLIPSSNKTQWKLSINNKLINTDSQTVYNLLYIKRNFELISTNFYYENMEEE